MADEKSLYHDFLSMNYNRLTYMLPGVVIIGVIMSVLSVIISDKAIIRFLLIGLTIGAGILYGIMVRFRPENSRYQWFHSLIIDAGILLFLFWGAAMVGFNPNSYINFLDLAIAFILSGVVCHFPLPKLLILYSLPLVFLFFFTPFFDRSTENTALLIVSIHLMAVLSVLIGSLLYRKSRENFLLNTELMNYQEHLETLVQIKTRELQEKEGSIAMEVVSALANVIEYYDQYTRGHSENVARLARRTARAMGLSLEKQQELYWAGMLHDIGKIQLPREVLHKEGPLTGEELAKMQTHPRLGYQMLKDSQVLQEIASIVLNHHERYDGRGYPRGLQGSAIPLSARILSLADAWDAMNSKRSYRDALSFSEAREEVLSNTGTQFAPDVVVAFMQIVEEEGSQQDASHACINSIVPGKSRNSSRTQGRDGEL